MSTEARRSRLGLSHLEEGSPEEAAELARRRAAWEEIQRKDQAELEALHVKKSTSAPTPDDSGSQTNSEAAGTKP